MATHVRTQPAEWPGSGGGGGAVDLSGLLRRDELGQPNGVAELGANGLVLPSELPESTGGGGGSTAVGPSYIGQGDFGILPAGQKLLGGNLIIKNAHRLPEYPSFPGQGAWANMYAEWDWNGWIKPQVDAVLAIGGNAVRLMGDNFGLALEMYSQSYYFAKWRQFIEYCLSKDVWVYACGGGRQQPADLTLDEEANLVGQYCAMVQEYPNVFACDIRQEWNAASQAQLTAFVGTIRSYGVTMPLSVSRYDTNPSSTSTNGVHHNSGLDVIDVHYYAQTVGTPTFSHVTTMGGWPMPVIIGEIGGQWAAPATLTFLRACRNFLALNPQVIGCFYWAITDGASDSPNQYGLFDTAFNQRTGLTAVWKSFPKRPTPWPVELHPTSDTTVNATISQSNMRLEQSLTLHRPYLARITAMVDINVTASSNVYSAAAYSSVGEAFAGSSTTPRPFVSGVGVQRITFSHEQVLPQGVNLLRLDVGHDSGSATDASVLAANTRAVFELMEI